MVEEKKNKIWWRGENIWRRTQRHNSCHHSDPNSYHHLSPTRRTIYTPAHVITHAITYASNSPKKRKFKNIAEYMTGRRVYGGGYCDIIHVITHSPAYGITYPRANVPAHAIIQAPTHRITHSQANVPAHATTHSQLASSFGLNSSSNSCYRSHHHLYSQFMPSPRPNPYHHSDPNSYHRLFPGSCPNSGPNSCSNSGPGSYHHKGPNS